MTTFQKFLSDWREQNMSLVNPQGSYIVWGYWLPQGTGGRREHVCTFRDLGRCIAEANRYANKKRFAQIVASTGTLVYDTRKPDERQAERCPVCRHDLDKSPERIEAHGFVFNSLACLVTWEADKQVEA